MLARLRARFIGRHIVVVGFDDAGATSLWKLLSGVGAFSGCAARAVAHDGTADLYVVSLSGVANADREWIFGACSTPALLVGSIEQVAELGERSTRAALEFVIEPWREDDLLLRCARLLPAGAVPVAEQPPSGVPDSSIEPAAEEPPPDTEAAQPDAAATDDALTEEHAPGAASIATEPESDPSALDLPAAPAEQGSPARTPRIVVADDDPVTIALIKAAARAEGFDCSAASDGLDALKLVESETPDLLILDVSMPGYDGFEVLSMIRDRPDKPRVMMLTASKREVDAVRGFELGAEDFVSKPFNLLELRARMRKLVRR